MTNRVAKQVLVVREMRESGGEGQLSIAELTVVSQVAVEVLESGRAAVDVVILGLQSLDLFQPQVFRLKLGQQVDT